MKVDRTASKCDTVYKKLREQPPGEFDLFLDAHYKKVREGGQM